MHDIRQIRENPEAFDAALAKRGMEAQSPALLALDASRRAKISAAEAALAERNAASKQVGAAKAKGDEAEFERLRALVSTKKEEIARLEEEAKAEDQRLNDALMSLPNLPLDDVPTGRMRPIMSRFTALARRANMASSRRSISKSARPWG